MNNAQIAAAAAVNPCTPTHTAKLTTADARPILKALGSDYKGRKFTLAVQSAYTVSNIDTSWQGGSKTEVTFLRQNATCEWEAVNAGDCMPSVVVGAATIRGTILVDVMVVERSWFCGKDCGYRFIVAPISVFTPRFLLA